MGNHTKKQQIQIEVNVVLWNLCIRTGFKVSAFFYFLLMLARIWQCGRRDGDDGAMRVDNIGRGWGFVHARSRNEVLLGK
jgi:hypothetical protein